MVGLSNSKDELSFTEDWEKDQEFSIRYNKLGMFIPYPCSKVKKTVRLFRSAFQRERSSMEGEI